MGLFGFIGKNKNHREEAASADEWRRETNESARETAAKGYEKAIAEGMEEGQALHHKQQKSMKIKKISNCLNKSDFQVNR